MGRCNTSVFKKILAAGLLASTAAAFAQANTPTISCSTNPAIFNTGIDGTNGYSETSGKITPANGTMADAHWNIAPIAGTVKPSVSVPPYDPTQDATLNFQPASVYYNGAWAVSPFGNAQWIGSGVFSYGTVFYRYDFNLDPSINPSTFNLKFDLYVDDSIYQVYVNGVPLFGAGTHIGGYTQSGFASIILNQHWQTGANSIIIQTYNATNPTGLLVQAPGSNACGGPINVEKTISTASAVTPGATLPAPYVIKITNNSAGIISGATLNDPLAAGLSSGTWTCSVPSPSTATCPVPATGALPINGLALPDMPSGSQLRFSIQATASANPPPVITNTATVAPAAGSPSDICINGSGANSCTASASVSTGPYLSIQKSLSGSGPFYPGDTVTYQLTVKNEGSVALNGVSVADNLPSGLENGQWSCASPVGSTAACPSPASGAISGGVVGSSAGTTLPSQSSLVYTITAPVTATVTAAQTVVNTASATSTTAGAACWMGGVSSALPCQSSASASLLPLMQIKLDKTTSNASTAYAGQSVNYSVTVENPGAIASSGSLSDALPAGLINGTWTCTASGSATCPAGASGGMPLAANAVTLPAGGKLTYAVLALVDAAPPASITNTASWVPDDATHTQCYPNGASTAATPCDASATILASAAPVLSITNSVSPSAAVVPGSTVVYTIVASNAGIADAPQVVVATDTPANITQGAWTCAASGGASCPAASGSGPISQTVPNLPVGGSLTYMLTATVAPGAPNLSTLTLLASSTTSLPVNATCSPDSTAVPCQAPAAITTSGAPVLSITNTVDKAGAVPGDALVYTVTASNTAGVTVSNANISVSQPPSVTFGSWTCAASGGATCPAASGSGAPNASVPTLPVGGVLTYTINATLSSSATPGTTLSSTASIAPSAMAATCADAGSAPCTAVAAVVVGQRLPVPVNAAWMLALLALGLGGLATLRQRRV